MTAHTDLMARWQNGVVLKRDVFSTIERGRFRTDRGEVDAVLRRLDEVPWWSAPLAHILFNRERRALAAAGPLGIATPLLAATSHALVRGWIDGVALHIAKPHGDLGYFRSAKAVLRTLHRAGICHNDLAKEQNWLRTPDGRCMLTDFQLAGRFSHRGKLFRVAAYEDLRHLLKHKRRYVPDALTPMERKILARKSLLTRVWMATGKKVYYAITRGVFRFTDREGGGKRLIEDAPRIAQRIGMLPGVRGVAVVTYPDRRAGTGLYAFIEADGVAEADALRVIDTGITPPERVQIVARLPRNAAGEVRQELLQLVAMNQLDLIEPLIADDAERETLAAIIAGRQNLRDRFAY
ncbi:MAG: serine/threonine protein kinase [Pseudolabrys sp.]|nr:serine/threonine protein kinase [Pseudolabrys sp.]MCW5685911.1 serine/threonine protein kinase [Pseudolabrys sp.]